jgi:DNA-binding transcriptional ArsR family regulator
VSVDEVFTALADATRRDVIWTLAEHGGCTATQLAADMPITRQAVAKHLMHLRRANLVVAERRGRETHYRLTPRLFGDAIDWLDEVCGRTERKRAA